MKKHEINKSVSLKTVELKTKTRLISNRRNRMFLSLVTSWEVGGEMIGNCWVVNQNNPI